MDDVNDSQMFSKVDYSLKPHQPGNDKNRAGSMAMWVAPIRVYCHHLENIHICYFFSFLYLPGNFGGRDKKPKGDNIFDTLKRNEWSVMCGPGCKTFLLNPVYSSLEIHYRQVVPYLVIVGNPISNKRPRFCLYTIYVEREMQAFC